MYLKTLDKSQCTGCEACIQTCSSKAISLEEDSEGFRYPVIDNLKCTHCGACERVCPFENTLFFTNEKFIFGGYHKNETIRKESTSGGAFSAIVESFCDSNYVIFGAEAKGLEVFHSFVNDKKLIQKFRRSKYTQSHIGDSYKQAKNFLKNGQKVLFSGTPCQIAGLKNFLGKTNTDKLLTIEVVCEGVPTPLYIRKKAAFLKNKYGSDIETFDYRYTKRGLFSKGTWDFQNERIILKNGITLKQDRWWNPYWSIWLQHLMSRPSCYHCQFTKPNRCADITLGDLWGVHLYCPELYESNLGSSLIIANSEKGKKVVNKSSQLMDGHELSFDEAIKYQGPLRKHIDENLHRDECMMDMQSDMDYEAINQKWAKKPTLKLLWQKYVWGNRQKVLLWKLKKRLFHK